MTTAARARYKGHRFPAEIIGHAVWLYFRFPLGLRMVEELLAARGIIVSHTVRQWARKFGQRFANQIRRRLPRVGGKWHLDEVVLKLARLADEAIYRPDHFSSRAVRALLLYPMCSTSVRMPPPGISCRNPIGHRAGFVSCVALATCRRISRL